MSLIIVGVAVFVKITLGTYFKKMGKKAKSDALIASGTDALFDSIISLSTLAAAVIYIIFDISLEAYLSVIISVVIIKSGIEILRDTLSKILGERVDSDLSKNIKAAICETEGVKGAYDLVLNNYGPGSYIASVHIEVPDYFTADKIDAITREIQRRVLEQYSVYVAAVGIYSYNTKNEKAAKIREEIEKIIFSHDNILQVHGFYLNEEQGIISVDFIAGFENKEHNLYLNIKKEIETKFPEYKLDLAMDTDISD